MKPFSSVIGRHIAILKGRGPSLSCTSPFFSAISSSSTQINCRDANIRSLTTVINKMGKENECKSLIVHRKDFPPKPFICPINYSKYSTSSCKCYNIEDVKSLACTPGPHNNIPTSIVDKLGKNLHLNESHPLGIIKKRIETFCNQYAKENNQSQLKIFDSLSPVVSTKQCFDDLLVGKDHVSRRPTDTYYINESTVLRTHTSAHQVPTMTNGTHAFLCSGDVYRRDEIDSSHYPVFHQMEGVRIFPKASFPPNATIEEKKKLVEADLKAVLTGLAKHLFGDVEMRWNSDYFPFTDPSFELEVLYNNKWMEVLGCGVIHDQVIRNANISGSRSNNSSSDIDNNSNKDLDVGWAFGLGLERLAMVLFDIPDIRLFWSTDNRFTSQFKPNQIIKFQTYSKYPMCYKDVSFWLPPVSPSGTEVHPNDVYELIRNVAGDIVEKVALFDEFKNPKNGKKSQAYRIEYRHMDRNLTNAEVDELQLQVRNSLVEKLNVTLR